jgi:RND family efflux transporter MFP subunit
MLRITVHDTPRTLTFQLEGRLAGPWVRELEECWQSALASQPKPILRLDLSGLTFINGAGQACLAALHRQGAEFVAPDCLTKAVVAEITQPAIPDSGRPKGKGQRRAKRNQGATRANSPLEEESMKRAIDMSDIPDAALDRDIGLEDFAAQLTSAVYPVALRRGLKASWLKMELGLWRALAEVLKKWDRQRPSAASAAALEAWRDGLLVDLSESAFYIALRNGVQGSLLEVELALYRVFRRAVRRAAASANQPDALLTRRLPLGLGFVLLLGLCLGTAGCSGAPAKAPAAPPVSVPVSYAVEREVADYADFTARTAAVDSVEVRAHVWGYLDKVNFKEGALVKKGDVLFEIDPRPYQALLDQAKGKVLEDQAQLAYHEADYRRYQELIDIGGVSKSDLDRVKAARGVDLANIAADQALVASRQLDLDYTKVTAPVSGRVSRYVVTVGNLIQSGDQNGGTLLTTLVSVDPMYAYFDVDEHTALRVRQLVREGKSDSPRDGGYPVSLGLANEDGHPHRGTINFVDNQVNPKTGTGKLRGVFPNQDQSLLAGLFARVRIPIGRAHKAVLVSERALDTDQGQKVLYLVNEKNEVVSRPVRLEALHDGLREITEGLKPGEKVIVNGLQQVRPGITVEPKLVDMPGQNPKSEVRNPKQIPNSRSQ